MVTIKNLVGGDGEIKQEYAFQCARAEGGDKGKNCTTLISLPLSERNSPHKNFRTSIHFQDRELYSNRLLSIQFMQNTLTPIEGSWEAKQCQWTGITYFKCWHKMYTNKHTILSHSYWKRNFHILTCLHDSSIKHFQTKFFVARQKLIRWKIRIYFLTKSTSLTFFTY